MLKMSSAKSIGTPIRCPSCKHPNLAIDIWCEKCGTPLDWKKNEAPVAAAAAPRPAPVIQARPPAPPEPPTPVIQTRAAMPPPPPPKTVPPSPQLRTRSAADPATEKQAPRVYCWSCGTGNAAGDRFCGRCGSALTGRPGARQAAARPAHVVGSFSLPKVALPAITLPRVSFPALKAPRLSAPAFGSLQFRLPQLAPLTWMVGAVVLLLLIIPLAYIAFPAHKSTAALQRSTAGTHQPKTSTGSSGLPAGSPKAVAAAGVEAKTGLKFISSCHGTAGCLSITGQTMGQDAAAIVFSTAKSGGQECVGYVARTGSSWQFVNAACGAPGRVSPMVGRDAAVHVPGNCARVRNSASLQAGVLTCLYDGTTVHVDGGPVFADALLWWHTTRGWIAHSFLVS